MDFDRKTIIAFILIGLVLILANTGLYQKLVDPVGYERRQQAKENLAERGQPPAIEESRESNEILEQLEQEPVPKTIEEEPKESSALKTWVTSAEETEKIITVETDLVIATLSTVGASIKQWQLKKYEGVRADNVTLFPENEYGTTGISFTTNNGDSLDTSFLNFNTDTENNIVLTGNDSVRVDFTLPIGEGRSITKSFIFTNKSYDITFALSLENMDDIISQKRYFMHAPNGLASTEKRLKDDMMYAKAGTASGGEVEKGYKPNGRVNKISGDLDWVAVRTKYFAFFIIPESRNSNYAEIVGEEISVSENEKAKWKKYSLKVAMPYLGEQEVTETFKLYLGPLEYDILKSYDLNLQDFMEFGWSLIKPFSMAILVVFKWMHNFIPNYGVVLLIFALLIKIIVYPLTHKSYESMQKMQKVQPKLKEIQEKYKNDPQKLNKATMALYKEEKVNPMGGCLPMLLQMPLLFGLFIVFRTTIELRGEGFIFWITDLSAPDTIYTFPGGFSLPLYGDSVNILPLVMGLTMFLQQKMTVTDPKQKMMVYFMPIFLTLLFNSFPSGLNLYYALFNALTIIQQKYLTPKKMKQESPTVQKRKK